MYSLEIGDAQLHFHWVTLAHAPEHGPPNQHLLAAVRRLAAEDAGDWPNSWRHFSSPMRQVCRRLLERRGGGTVAAGALAVTRCTIAHEHLMAGRRRRNRRTVLDLGFLLLRLRKHPNCEDQHCKA